MLEWNACTLEPNALLRWIECHSSLGGYIAAVGTVAAVFSAIWTSRQALRFEGDRNSARARIVAFRLTPLAIDIDNSAKRALTYAEQSNYGLDHIHDLDLVRMGLVITLEIPKDAFTDAWALPASLAKRCIELDASLRQYQRICEKRIPQLRDYNSELRQSYLSIITESLTLVATLAEEVRKSLLDISGGFGEP